ncbi:hypothetical protein DESUT3_40180 [Desulfuromonas versatilis]|uniref:Rho termination factor N-terminal domain-containing protein n=1 Tax=Desulfuromonas versatilis TaxID=2802975 RepID=A0ABM8HY39_9BACT|nr:Rho termination factor N-terminal domain-containing protein [Desulfuromonas versatilis]BCR06949.1 hypothetical protein DESUT3_40180 [Desulfuromonas versatilis]
MNVTEIRDRAKNAGVKQAAKLRKADLIRAIQVIEGNQGCYGVEWRFSCGQADCCWRQDCLTPNPG